MSIIDDKTKNTLENLEKVAENRQTEIVDWHAAQLMATIELVRAIDKFDKSSSKTAWNVIKTSILATAIITSFSVYGSYSLQKQRKEIATEYKSITDSYGLMLQGLDQKFKSNQNKNNPSYPNYEQRK